MPEKPKPIKPKRTKGKPLPLTDEELDAMSEITPADIAGAKALWDEFAPPDMRGLLDAKPEDDG